LLTKQNENLSAGKRRTKNQRRERESRRRGEALAGKAQISQPLSYKVKAEEVEGIDEGVVGGA
jgi:hypothetical protein